MNTQSDFASLVAQLQPDLLRYAKLQLRSLAWAEDAVSETVLAALAKPQAFGNRSALKTWLIGILKHKIIDTLRMQGREVASSSLGAVSADEDEASLDIEALSTLQFDAHGFFEQAPAQWAALPQGPDQATEQKQFFAILEWCMDNLPEAQARVFMMREWLELDATEVCKELRISATNLYVLLHRARLQLRECLQLKWFSSHES